MNILLDQIRTTFLLNFEEVRALDAFPEAMAVLLMENWSSQIIIDVIGLLIEGRTGIIAFVPPTTQNFQVFDVNFFDVLKRHPRYELAFRGEEVTVKRLL
jgi:hypothetical protein